MAIVQNVKGLVGGYRSKVYISDGMGGNIQFNVASDITENDQNNITAHAIESGSPVTDHVIAIPKSFSITGILTDDITDPTEYPYNILKFGDLKEQMNTLESWITGKTQLTYYSYEDDFSDIIIESASRKTSLDTGFGIGLSLSLKKIKVVNSVSATVKLSTPNMKGQTAKGADTAPADLKSQAYINSHP